jgi:hypothetical protein
MIMGGGDHFPEAVPIRNGALNSIPRGTRTTSSGDHISAVVSLQTDQRSVDSRGVRPISDNVPKHFNTSSGASNNARDDFCGGDDLVQC